MNAFSRGSSVRIRSRQCSSTSTAVVCFDRICRANSSMVKVFTGVGAIVRAAAEPGAAKKARALSERLEKRFELRQAAMFGVGDGRFQPVFDGHSTSLVFRPSSLDVLSQGR